MPLNANDKIDRERLPAPAQLPIVVPNQFPDDSVELCIERIVSTLLRCEQVPVGENLFHLGGNSLLAMSIASEINRTLGVSLELHQLFQNPTVRGMASQVRRLRAALGRPRDPLVVLSEGDGEATPLFLIHPAAGNAMAYLALARELPGRKIIGLEEPDRSADCADLAGLVAHYAQRIRDVHPDGPWIVGGWSFGGLVAAPLARELEAAGQVHLVLIDSSVPRDTGLRAEEIDRRRFLEYVGTRLGPQAYEEASRIDQSLPEVEYVRQLASAAGLDDLDPAIIEDVVGAYHRSFALITGYRAPRVNAPTTLIRASDPLPAALRDSMLDRMEADLGWHGAIGSLRVIPVAGNHLSMMTPPHVAGVAAALIESSTAWEEGLRTRTPMD